ncbi:unnamed protein product [Peronospora belbahrii]|uniref:Extracellular membrane protein CFEM domain-containing protein n=1 Tax=Peronospora belbahrii TaxID=622444 RepID=A0AAU9KQP6_9STRA|nr:unnamed protein product [Peronospora belbahrii]
MEFADAHLNKAVALACNPLGKGDCALVKSPHFGMACALKDSCDGRHCYDAPGPSRSWQRSERDVAVDVPRAAEVNAMLESASGIDEVELKVASSGLQP